MIEVFAFATPTHEGFIAIPIWADSIDLQVTIVVRRCHILGLPLVRHVQRASVVDFVEGRAGLVVGKAGLVVGKAGLVVGKAGLVVGKAGLVVGRAGLVVGRAGLVVNTAVSVGLGVAEDTASLRRKQFLDTCTLVK